VTLICGLVVDADAGRLASFLAKLPALVSIDGLGAADGLSLQARSGAAVAATQDFLAGAARAIGRCSCLRRLDLHVTLANRLEDRVSAKFWQHLAEARALKDLSLTITACKLHAQDWSATVSVSHLIAGLAGLSRLRTLALTLGISGVATLPACILRLVALTSLTLHDISGLRCAPGWARLPALECLDFRFCEFAAEGEDALPGMDALASLTSLVMACPSLRTLPASLWRLTRLRKVTHWLNAVCNEPPAVGLPASAPCFASLTDLCLQRHALLSFPACITAMTSLVSLDLSDNCFEQLPDAVSVLTALEALYLGRISVGLTEIGGTLDARALGSLARFPNLHSLQFHDCSVLFDAEFHAAAGHPCLRELVLVTSYPAPGPSCGAFLAFVVALLKQGRAGVLRLENSVVQGAGQQDGQNFRGALQATGFALHEDDSDADTV